MKGKALLLIGLGFLIVFGIGIITSVLILNVADEPNEPNRYIATDDISMVWNEPEYHAEFNGSQTFIVSGEYVSDVYSRFYSAWIQFDLTDRPDNWKNVEISLYNFESDGVYGFKGIDSDLYAYIQDWNDTMTHEELKSCISDYPYYYWRETNLGYNIRLHNELGLQKINITNPLRDYFDKGHDGFISLLLSGMYGGDGYVKVYSKEWNGNKSYLPQLIWS